MNVMNIFAGILSFIIGMALAYAFFGPITNMITEMDTSLKVFMYVSFILVLFTCIVVIPYKMFTTDDQAQ